MAMSNAQPTMHRKCKVIVARPVWLLISKRMRSVDKGVGQHNAELFANQIGVLREACAA